MVGDEKRMTIADYLDASTGAETPLLDDVVDYKGRPVLRKSSGGWRSASFVIVVEILEKLAYYGISSNLITYLTGPLGQSTATAAQNVNAWLGTALLLPLFGAFVADTFLGRYRTIVVASLLEILGLGMLTLSAMLPSLNHSLDCHEMDDVKSCHPSRIHVILFFSSLYLVAVSQGGFKPCLQAFAADQFDGNNLEERKAKSSFFNWWYFGFSGGTLLAYGTVSIQENLGWSLGFGILCIVMAVGLIVLVLGTRAYRYSVKGDAEHPFIRIYRVFAATFGNWRTPPSEIAIEDQESRGILPHESSEQFKFLNKALLAPIGLKEDGKVCSAAQVEEAKAVLRLVPIWVTCLVYGIVFSQSSTLFTKQGSTMERKISSNFYVPAASLQSFITIGILLFVPIYDRIFVPIARAFTKKPSGITKLQRIGIGIFFSLLSMVVAAVVEMKRLKTAQEYDLVDRPSLTIPMSVMWLVPQYLLFGIADVFTVIGLQEFFYDQVPSELRSLGLALYLSIFGVGHFLSGFLISFIEKTTSGGGTDSWFSNNLNRAHLDYFYWLLAGLSAIQLLVYLYFAKSYIYYRGFTK
ncbi:hypothetical protein FNV43_RR10589 [Rhamnella rubrinervis]|uniref:Protein NRT1/ PTR FAMILY 5.10-like n=1 Tax=Rhamnella rubrinervis TaxID=2594499 RepID=A0A8K0H4D4_9ROSA|nr:hypothetical protein FNV43_RR10589 [Rhamnella rubrinervis]